MTAGPRRNPHRCKDCLSPSAAASLEAITPLKQSRLIQAARYYLFKHPHQGPLRFDALGLQKQSDGTLVYTHIKNAIQSD